MAWKVIQVILERRLEMCDQPMDTVRPRCTRVKPGKGVHSGNYYKLPTNRSNGSDRGVELGMRCRVRVTREEEKTADAACARRIRVTTFLELWRWQSRPVKVGAFGHRASVWRGV